MSNLRDSQKSNPYNDEPVYYCKNCLSLHIQIIGNPDDNDSLCVKCNRTDIGITDIYTWRELWKDRYGKYPED